MEKDQKNTASLSWKLDDYTENNIEPPERIKESPQKTEGEMMRDSEMQEWFTESVRVLKVIYEEDPDAFEKIYNGFLADVIYLNQLGRLDEDVIMYARDMQNFEF